VIYTLLLTPLTAAAADDFSITNQMQREQRVHHDAFRTRFNTASDVFSNPDDSEVIPSLEADQTDMPCFTLREVRWSSVLPPDDLVTRGDSVVGQCVGINTLRTLQSALNESLTHHGLVTSRVVVPEQSLSSGVLTLQYLPGRLSSIEGQSLVGWSPMIMPGTEDDDLNQYDLDQMLENVRRLKGQRDARIDIVPGSEFGTSRVVLYPGTGKRWHGYFGADNSGSKEMGRSRLNAGLILDSPFYLYDQLVVGWSSNSGVRSHSNYTYAKSLNYSVPFGYWSGFVGLSKARYQQGVSGYSEPILYGGTTRQVDAGINVVPYRGSRYKGTTVLKVFHKRVASTINNIAIDVQRQDLIGYDVGHQHRHYLGRAVLDLGVGVRGSVPQFSHYPGYVAGRSEWNGRSTIFTANAGAYVPFMFSDMSASYQLNWQMQHARTPILSSDYFVIGDRHSVRGFDGQMTLASESGWTLRSDVSLMIGDNEQHLYVGLDVGNVSGRSSSYGVGHTLVGAVAGIRGRAWVSNVDVGYELAIGRPVRKPELLSVSSVVVTAAMSIEF